MVYFHTRSFLLLLLALHELACLFVDELLEPLLGQIVQLHVEPEGLLRHRFVTYGREEKKYLLWQ